MFCVSLSVRKVKIIAAAVLGCIAAVGIAAVLNSRSEKKNIILENNTSRVGFLNINGYDVEEEPSDCITVSIPSEFNRIYSEYNNIQLEQGFDLEKYMGQSAEIYTYQLSNNPDMCAVLIIHNNNLIGCDIHSAEYGGAFEALLKS